MLATATLNIALIKIYIVVCGQSVPHAGKVLLLIDNNLSLKRMSVQKERAVIYYYCKLIHYLSTSGRSVLCRGKEVLHSRNKLTRATI